MWHFDQYLRSEAHWQTLVQGRRSLPAAGSGRLAVRRGRLSQRRGGRLGAGQGSAVRSGGIGVRRDTRRSVHPAGGVRAHARRQQLPRGSPVCQSDRRPSQPTVSSKPHTTRIGSGCSRISAATIQATFTDEPSLIAVDLGQIPEPRASRVRVADPIDPKAKPLPCVPWCYDLPDRYRQRYGEDLLAQRRSLFAGDADADRRIRRQFWQLISELVGGSLFRRDPEVVPGASRGVVRPHAARGEYPAPSAAGRQRAEGADPHGHSGPGHAHLRPAGRDPLRLADGRTAWFRRAVDRRSPGDDRDQRLQPRRCQAEVRPGWPTCRRRPRGKPLGA